MSYRNFTDEEVRGVFLMRYQGNKITDIAKRYDTSTWTVSQILRRHKCGQVDVPDGHVNYATDKFYNRAPSPRRKKASTAKTRAKASRDTLAKLVALQEAAQYLELAIAECVEDNINASFMEAAAGYDLTAFLTPTVEPVNGRLL